MLYTFSVVNSLSHHNWKASMVFEISFRPSTMQLVLSIKLFFFSGNPAAFEKNTLVHTVGGTEDGNPETHFVTSSRKYFYMFSPWRASLLYLKNFEQKWAHLTNMVLIAH